MKRAALIVSDELNPATPIDSLALFLQLYARARWNYPFYFVFERSLPLPNTLEALHQINYEQPESHTLDFILYLGSKQIKIEDQLSGGFTDLGSAPPTIVFAYMDDYAIKPSWLSPEIYFSMSGGRRAAHELLHKILSDLSLPDKIDDHEAESEYYLLYEKVPRFLPSISFEQIERIDNPVPANEYPALNWNYITQRHLMNW